MGSIKNNIQEISEDIKKYSPCPEKVKLVAVTKYVGTEEMEAVISSGVNIVGENRVQVLREKKEKFDQSELGSKIKWHFIGNLQKNKVKYISDYVELIHSVNKLSLAKEINKRAEATGRVIEVLLEINIAGEESKEGYKIEKLYKELPEILKLKNIKVTGLMTMAPFTEDTELVRRVFRELRTLKDDLSRDYFQGELKELSMGMSGDYKIALEEGATLIRIGSKIFS
ncbi:YggS family pyridoxal phosphate-dependent enzyme [uncultured Ilyobacter sp.]|uniref:YggS family pyridoxal phosphate-dependent enzyme n=1 Tax=uncultured Ilyobacter sp. TaxID=544433 RepID=UPI002AA6127E|nr:YggS family pyridoxal phosphate-dependent enzyme [uncultured Ilyobacter sp.]